MQGQCFKHGFEAAEARCRKCGLEFCNECLVYSFGPKKPPYCVPCALAAAGVRSNSGPPAQVPRRELRRLERERRKAEKAGRKQTAGEVPGVVASGVTVEVDAEIAEQEGNPFAWADAQDEGRVPF